ncbi:hypothetical protein GGR58DRAFT_458464, partial [Xylaria digitata]
EQEPNSPPGLPALSSPPPPPPAPPVPGPLTQTADEQRAKRKRRSKKRSVQNSSDEAVAAANERDARMSREARWEHFLKGEIKEARLQPMLEKILGAGLDPDSQVWEDKGRQLVAYSRRLQHEVLRDNLKWLKKHLDSDESLADLKDVRAVLSDSSLLMKIRRWWSWERFYLSYNYLKAYMDGEASGKRAQYYCRQLWEQLTLESLRYLRTGLRDEMLLPGAQEVRIARYVAMPSHDNLKYIQRKHFVEKPPGEKGVRAKKPKLDVTSTLAHTQLAPPPDFGSEENDDDDDDDDNDNDDGPSLLASGF